MSASKSKKENKNIKALFSVICLCIIALGLVVTLAQSRNKTENNPVHEATSLLVTTEVQKAVTLKETTKKKETTTAKKKKETATQPTTMEQNESNTPYQSYYKYPLSEAVLGGYSEELVYDETMGDYRAHAAVDFKGSEGDKVCAINDGIVTAVYKNNLWGQVVEIDHGGKLVARYCGLKSVSVKKGSRVNIGNSIGTLGTAPAEGALEAHLHFETVLDGKSVNPLDVMGKTE